MELPKQPTVIGQPSSHQYHTHSSDNNDNYYHSDQDMQLSHPKIKIVRHRCVSWFEHIFFLLFWLLIWCIEEVC